ncbi:hypothetical protein ZWY2020_042180 [Hordeum vulgare]|nr:hypothetical protein ZWY2020_042180 [Hordeum vulgare]
MVWLGIQPGAGTGRSWRGRAAALPQPGHISIRSPPPAGRAAWGRQGCRFDAAGRGKCATGDCGGASTATALAARAPGHAGRDHAGRVRLRALDFPTTMELSWTAQQRGHRHACPTTAPPGANCLPAGCVSDSTASAFQPGFCQSAAATGSSGAAGVRERRSGAPSTVSTGQFPGGRSAVQADDLLRLRAGMPLTRRVFACFTTTRLHLTVPPAPPQVVTFAPHRR